MDLSCIIESGDLELFALGLLPEEDGYKIAQLANLFPELNEELNAITNSLQQLNLQANAAPSASVKTALLNRLVQLKPNDKAPLPPAETASYQNNQGGAKLVTMEKKRNRTLLVASVAGLLIATGFVAYLAMANQKNKSQLATLQQQVKTLESSYQSQQQQLQAYSNTLQMVYNKAYRQIQLSSVPGKPPAQADVFWNTKTKDVFVADVTLPPPPAHKQYQLWAIVNGKPVSAGLLNGSKMEMQKMKPFKTADAFAITLEQKGGSPAPTMEAMYVMSKV